MTLFFHQGRSTFCNTRPTNDCLKKKSREHHEVNFQMKHEKKIKDAKAGEKQKGQ